jgi:molecular chaperone DnaK
VSELIIGIDLGTTNSLVAICENGVPQILKNEDGEAMVPSVIHYNEKTNIVQVGAAAKQYKTIDSTRTAFSVKRYMGLGKKDLKNNFADLVDTSLSTDQNIIIKLGSRSFSAIQLSSEILKKLKALAENSLKKPVSKAVITVPAYFNDSQRSATKAAGLLAGLDVIRIINEPTAAALAYGINKIRQGLIAVYDLGGGTFDISILRLHDGIFEVLSTNGDTALGGDDFDQIVFNILKNQISGQAASDQPSLNDVSVRSALLDVSEKMKIGLASQDEVTSSINVNSQNISLKLTKAEFKTACTQLVEKTIKIAELAIKDAHIQKNEIDEIVLVGGSTRLQVVRDRLKTFFDQDINLSVNPDEAVALGAAIQADILAGLNRDTVLLDVVPLSLGIETYGGTIGKLVHRNSKIPIMAKETFTTHVDGQKNVLIHVLQGERELAIDCRSLAKFDLRGLPPMPAGLPKIEVTFIIDASGLLKVRAKELTTRIESIVEVKPSYGLTDEQVEKMLSDSFVFAERDMKARQLIDTRVQAEGVLHAARKIIKEAAKLQNEQPSEKPKNDGKQTTSDNQTPDVDQQNMASEQIIAMELQISECEKLMIGEDYIALKDGLEKLEDVAKGIAEVVMNSALRGTLNQKSVHEVLNK